VLEQPIKDLLAVMKPQAFEAVAVVVLEVLALIRQILIQAVLAVLVFQYPFQVHLLLTLAVEVEVAKVDMLAVLAVLAVAVRVVPIVHSYQQRVLLTQAVVEVVVNNLQHRQVAQVL
jgi:hypothetical protein